MRKSNKNNRRRTDATEQYFCISYVAQRCSLSLFLSLSLSFSLRNINIRNIRTFRDERLG